MPAPKGHESDIIEKKKTGRPKIIIDWDKVDLFLEAGCSGAQVANNLGFDPNTLYAKCVEEKGISFSEYSTQKSSKGEAELTLHQYLKALGKRDTGDNTLLIWLGKTRLKQKEHEDQVITKEVESKFEQLMKQMKQDKESIKTDDNERSSINETA
jgi:hypothetical protein